MKPAASDVDLVEQVLSRRPQAIDRFVERMQCVPRFVAVINHSLGLGFTDEDAEDLVQGALVVIWRKLGQFEGRSKLETWVYRIVRWELMNEVRRRRRAPQPLPEEDVESPASAIAEHDRLDYACLMSALEELPRPESAVVELRHFEHLPFARAADRLSIPVETAKTRYYRALRNLERTLAPRFDEEIS